MDVIEKPIDWPQPYERNPRRNDKAVEKVASSIREFGFRQPIVTDEDGVVLVGHTRLKAAIDLGLSAVPVHIASGLSEDQKRAYRIADNRVGEDAGWDHDLLALEVGDLQPADRELTGFSELEIRRMLTDQEPEPEDPETVETRASLGDLWRCGEHVIACGDATDAVLVARLLEHGSPHLMVTDPPYGVEYAADWRNDALRADGTAVGAHAVSKVSNDDNADWREAWALFPGDVVYCWHAGLRASIVQDSLQSVGFVVRAQIIWAKSNIVIGRGDYHVKHEPCWYAVRNGVGGHWQGDRKQATVWNIDKPMKSETGHSTQKPVECMLRPILNNSAKGDAVYDPFLGSGMTVIAAERSGRACLGIELSPEYVDICLARWETETGKEAEKL